MGKNKPDVVGRIDEIAAYPNKEQEFKLERIKVAKEINSAAMRHDEESVKTLQVESDFFTAVQTKVNQALRARLS